MESGIRERPGANRFSKQIFMKQIDTNRLISFALRNEFMVEFYGAKEYIGITFLMHLSDEIKWERGDNSIEATVIRQYSTLVLDNRFDITELILNELISKINEELDEKGLEKLSYND